LKKKFLINYIDDIRGQLDLIENYSKNILEIIKIIKKLKNTNKKVIIYGNGGSASTASHFSTDLTKNARIKCINFNESNLITCFSNDYGFENFVSQALKEYSSKGDIVILISVSGESKNLLNAANYCKKNKIKLITLTGKNKKNSLIKKNFNGKNIFINSKSYNIVEICHHIILLTIIDCIIGKKNYGTKIGTIKN
jgi:D-sedoheptulose 7-phosphate isomerase